MMKTKKSNHQITDDIKKGSEELKNHKTQKIINKKARIRPYISILTLNINVLN